MVTHQLAEAQRIADRMGILRQGRILQEGTPEQVMLSPASKEIAKLLGYTHVFEDGNGRTFPLHPGRVVPGEHPNLGLVVHGTVKRRYLYEAWARVELELPSHNGATVDIDVPIDSDIQPGLPFVFTIPEVKR